VLFRSRFGVDGGRSSCYKYVDRGGTGSADHLDKHRGVRMTYAKYIHE
jgi:hypothetical protein